MASLISESLKQTKQERSEQQARYNARCSKQISLKFNRKNDADIITWLNRQQSTQGAIKQLIRAAIAAEQEAVE